LSIVTKRLLPKGGNTGWLCIQDQGRDSGNDTAAEGTNVAMDLTCENDSILILRAVRYGNPYVCSKKLIIIFILK
jgi:hypothetical protein